MADSPAKTTEELYAAGCAYLKNHTTYPHESIDFVMNLFKEDFPELLPGMFPELEVKPQDVALKYSPRYWYPPQESVDLLAKIIKEELPELIPEFFPELLPKTVVEVEHPTPATASSVPGTAVQAETCDSTGNQYVESRIKGTPSQNSSISSNRPAPTQRRRGNSRNPTLVRASRHSSKRPSPTQVRRGGSRNPTLVRASRHTTTARENDGIMQLAEAAALVDRLSVARKSGSSVN